MDIKIPISILIGFISFLVFFPMSVRFINTFDNDIMIPELDRDKTAQEVSFEIVPEPKILEFEDIILMILTFDEKNVKIEYMEIVVKIPNGADKKYVIRFDDNRFWNDYRELYIEKLNADLTYLRTFSEDVFKNEAIMKFEYDKYGPKGIHVIIQ